MKSEISIIDNLCIFITNINYFDFAELVYPDHTFDKTNIKDPRRDYIDEKFDLMHNDFPRFWATLDYDKKYSIYRNIKPTEESEEVKAKKHNGHIGR